MRTDIFDGARLSVGTALVSEPSSAPLNYFNYFTEIEDHFLKRRRSHMLVSPLDWSLMETWKQRRIPLPVVIRGIDRAFDAYEARAIKYRKVNSLFYCEQLVEECFAEYRESRIGAAANAGAPAPAASPPEFSKEQLLEFLRARAASLAKADTTARPALREAGARALHRLGEIINEVEGAAVENPAALESELEAVEALLLDGADASLNDAERAASLELAKQQLKPYKQKMGKEVYERTLRNVLRKRTLEICRIPRLSLFFLS